MCVLGLGFEFGIVFGMGRVCCWSGVFFCFCVFEFWKCLCCLSVFGGDFIWCVLVMYGFGEFYCSVF